VSVTGGWSSGRPKARLAGELEQASGDEGLCEELVETFVREQRLSFLAGADDGAAAERAIPVTSGRSGGGNAGDVEAAPGPSDFKEKGAAIPVAQMSAGILAVWITAGMLLVVLHEHHHHTHNVPHGIERNLEYVLWSILTFSPILVLFLFGYFRNRHFDRVAELKNL
jgi:hypothetical protein